MPTTDNAAKGELYQPPVNPIPPIICNFSGYIDHASVTSWEFQLDVPSEKCLGLTRPALLHAVEDALLGLSANSTIPFEVFPNTLRTSVFDQVSTAVATLDARPLYPRKHELEHFPWKGPAFIRQVFSFF